MLEHRSNNTGHEDLYFRLGDYSCVVDSYYLALDAENDGPNGRIESILAQLLGSWINALHSTDPGTSVFLPFDFSDEFTRCLKCVKQDNYVEIQLGWSERAGYSVKPRNPGKYFHNIGDFHPETATPIRLPQAEFLKFIEDSLDHAKKFTNAETPLISEAALGEDWNRPEEDEAWSHLQ